MNKILFATANERKVREARFACQDFAIEVEQVRLTIDEIQSHDPLLISRHKAAEAFRQTHQPIAITDTSWNIPTLGGFPGGYMKDIAEWFRPEDFVNLVAPYADKRVSFTETIVYQDAVQTQLFSETYWGQIADHPRGKSRSIEEIVEYNGRTLAEHLNQGKTSHDPKEYVWYQFAAWFSKLL